MAVKSSTVTVTNAATLLATAENQLHEQRTYGRDAGQSVLVKNTSAVQIFVGGANVSTANGLPIDAGDALPVDLISADDLLYGVVATGTAVVNVLQAGV